MVLRLATATASCRSSTVARIILSTFLSLGKQPLQQPLPSSRRALSSPATELATKALKPGTDLLSQLGQTYTIQEILSEQLNGRLCVYHARYCIPPIGTQQCETALICRRSGGNDFIVKNVVSGEWDYQYDLQKSVASCPNVRTVVDGIEDPELFVYPYMKTNLLQFNQRQLSETQRRSMLKSALIGLVALHDNNILHTGTLIYQFLYTYC